MVAGPASEPPVVERRVTALRAALVRNGARVHRVDAEAAPARVAALVEDEAGGRDVAVSRHLLVEELGLVDVLRARGVPVLDPDEEAWRSRLPEAGVGLTGALLGAAAEGVVAVPAGPGAPRAVSLVPPVHVAVLDAAAVFDAAEDALRALASGPLPGALVFVGGPSRSADLEMRPTIGVHGPKVLHVVLVGGAAALPPG